MRRWVRYEAPIMVCVDLDDNGHGDVVAVVIGDDHEDITLARDHSGHFLLYDETMERVDTDEPAECRALTIAEHREWPARLTWEEGPDALRYPGLYDPVAEDDADEDDNEFDLLDLEQPEPER
jgi:hypothetical protein